MSDKIELMVQVYLHPTETVKVALETEVPVNIGMDDVATGKTESPHTHSEGARVEGRILAVISHRDDATSREEGCVFVYKMKPGLRSPLLRSSDNYFLEHAYPIVGDFSMTMAQARRNTIDLRQASAGTALSQPRTDLTVTLNPGHDENAAPLILVAHDTQSLKEVITECKRLREISTREHSEAFGAYTWLAPYIAEARRPPLLSSIPPDLRNLKQPLSVFLSSATAGQPGDEASDIALIRADWMRRKVEAELIPTCKAGRTLRLRIGTFNVNGKMPSQDLSVWLRHRDSGIAFIPPAKAISPLSLGEIARDPFDATAQSFTGEAVSRPLEGHERTAPSESSDILASDRADPDIFVLAFQELDLSTEALLYSTKTVREDAWVTATFAGLGEKAVLYEKLASKQLVGMLLIVVVKKMLKPSFDDIQTASIGAGIMGLMGNKGATALRLNYTPSSSDGHRPRPIVLTFVNSHLAAFDEMYERRNADFHDLSKRLVFDSGITGPPELNQGATGNATTIPISVFETDALFWMAYLNYRINLSDADIRSLLSSPPELRQSETRLLLQYDQLSTARRKKHAFENFLEHPITHPPSYRFSAGIAADQQGYDIKRKPAWTDRILPYGVRYVDAVFDIRAPSIDRHAYDSFVHGLWRKVATIEYSESIPKMRLSTSSIDFGDIYHRRLSTQMLQLENIGKIACAYRFVRAENEPFNSPGWFSVEPTTGLLLPGETTMIRISSYVDNPVASHLNRESGRLDFTLILHVALGKDYFISVTGQYQRTCFSNDLRWLSRLRGPVRTVTPTNLLPVDHATTAPKEIMRLINWIMSNATNVDELFLHAGPPDLVHEIKDCLDTGAEFKFDHVHSKQDVAWAFGDALLQLLDALPEPLLPTSLHPRCAEVTSRDEAFELLNELPSVALNVWISVTAVLHYIIQQSLSASTSNELVAKLTSILLRDGTVSQTSTSIVGKRRYLRYFIM